MGAASWFDADTGLRKPGLGPQGVELSCWWTRLRQTGELLPIRSQHSLSVVGGSHLVLLGGEAVGEDYAEHHQAHALPPDKQEPFGMSSFCLESGTWSKITAAASETSGGEGTVGPIVAPQAIKKSTIALLF